MYVCVYVTLENTIILRDARAKLRNVTARANDEDILLVPVYERPSTSAISREAHANLR